jgi:hypothetical protein
VKKYQRQNAYTSDIANPSNAGPEKNKLSHILTSSVKYIFLGC